MKDKSEGPRSSVLTQEPPPPPNPYVLSYIGLRRSVGIIGMALPIVLAIGRLIFDGMGLMVSISAYYYSPAMRNVLVGSMCAVGVFLLSYRIDRLSDFAGDVAGIAAFGVAFFPTDPAGANTTTIGLAHSIFAGIFLATLAFFALFLFPRRDPGKSLTPQKRVRNRIYRTCGVIMFLCFGMMMIDLFFLQGAQGLQALNPGFWLETVALVVFGIAWFVKGETILKDS